MQGAPTVLLVSLGDEPDGLRRELSVLGVKVVPCAFSDAEESMEAESPDLIILQGTRGSVELATVLDDQPEDTRIRMVIVAERKALAKLRGLNREIVVSLFAIETTEKVISQRIEALARRAVRRRLYGSSTAPSLPAQSLDANSTSASGIKITGQAPPVDLADDPVIAGMLRDVPVGAQLARNASRGPASEKQTAIGLPTAGMAIGQGEDEKAKALGAGEAPPAPSAHLADEASPDSLVVMDDELLESLPPSIIPEAGDELGAIPGMPPVPNMGEVDPAPVPPALPPEAKEQKLKELKEVPRLSSPGEYDISSAMGALDQLESSREPELSSASDDEEEKSERLEAHESVAAVGSEESSAEFKSSADDGISEGSSVSNELEKEDSSGDSDEPEKSEKLSPDEVVALLGEPKKVSDRKGILWGLVGVVLMGALGVYIGSTNDGKDASAVAEPPSRVEKPKASKVKKPAAAKIVLNEKKEEESPKAKLDAAQVAEEPEVPPKEEAKGDVKVAPTTVAPADAPAETPAPTSAPVAMAHPFVAIDTNMPSCEKLLDGNSIKATADPVHESSKAWAEARKAIVTGRLKKANMKMCEAVRLNSESAALEGLVQLYLRNGSIKQALMWLEKTESLRPGQLEMANSRGDLYGLQGDLEQARGVWLSALGLKASEKGRIANVSKDYSVEAGRLLRRGDLSKAELWFRRAVILNPENLTGLVGLAKTFQRAKKPEYSRAFCELSLRVSNVVPEIHVILGELALARGDRVEAKQRFTRALEVRPGFYPAKNGLRQVK